MADGPLPCFPASKAELEGPGGRVWGQGLGARLRNWVLGGEATFSGVLSLLFKHLCGSPQLLSGCNFLPTLSSPSDCHRSLPTKPKCRQSEPRLSTLRVDGAGKGGLVNTVRMRDSVS